MKNDPNIIKYEVPKQPKMEAPIFDSFDKNTGMVQALGSQRLKALLEQGYIQSLNWPSAG